MMMKKKYKVNFASVIQSLTCLCNKNNVSPLIGSQSPINNHKQVTSWNQRLWLIVDDLDFFIKSLPQSNIIYTWINQSA